jgi:hypothetical protein
MEVELFLSLLDRIINLVKQREIKKQQFFDKIIEPLFKELEPVVEDYFNLFRESLQMVRNSHNYDDLNNAVEKIRRNRNHLLQTRIKVREMADTIKNEVKDEKVVNFANDILKFFNSSKAEVPVDPKFISLGARLLELCDYVMTEKLSGDQLIIFLENELKNLESSWEAISKSHAMLRLENYKE